MGDGKLSTEAACDSLKEIISNQHCGLYCAYVDCSDQVQAFLVFFFFQRAAKNIFSWGRKRILYQVWMWPSLLYLSETSVVFSQTGSCKSLFCDLKKSALEVPLSNNLILK